MTDFAIVGQSFESVFVVRSWYCLVGYQARMGKTGYVSNWCCFVGIDVDLLDVVDHVVVLDANYWAQHD